jgi:hypothetical protein
MNTPGRPEDLGARNAITSYGLSLAAGLPLSLPVMRQIERLSATFSATVDGFIRYPSEQLHVTLVAFLRGRYRSSPPLRRCELPADLAAFAADLAVICASVSSFEVELFEARLGSDGGYRVEVRGGAALRASLDALARQYYELDAPRDAGEPWHCSIGYLRDSLEPARQTRSMALVPAFPMEISRVWLVHYANRTYSHIVGRIPLALGRPNHLTAGDLLAGLRIAA